MKQKDNKGQVEKADIQKLEQRLDGIDSRLESIDKNIDVTDKLLRLEIRLVVKDAVIQLEQTMTKFKDLILTTVDPLLKELETRREDREISSDQMLEIRGQLTSHENRLKRLEKPQQ